VTERPFRFGVVGAFARSGAEWTEKARQVEQLGYQTLLVPDRLTAPVLAAVPAVAAAAAATTQLRVGTFVFAAGLRHPAMLAKEAATLDLLSEGRFELGLGAGVGPEDYALLGVPFGEPRERADRLKATLLKVKELLEGETLKPASVQRPRPPILVAAGGPRLLRLAAREADVVALGLNPHDGERSLAERSALVREVGGDRPELSLNLVAAVGPEGTPPHLAARVRGYLKMELADLVAQRSPFVVGGDADAMAAQLQSLRERYGVTYVTVPDDVVDTFAPVIAKLC